MIENGESLVTDVKQNSGSPDKTHLYEYEERADVLAPRISRVFDEVIELPRAACPNDEAVIAVILHSG